MLASLSAQIWVEDSGNRFVPCDAETYSKYEDENTDKAP